MFKLNSIVLLVIIVTFLAATTYVLSEVVVLKDGSKYIGKITDESDKVKIATKDGELTIKKDRIKAIYKDAETINNELTDILTEAQKLVAGANKIEDPKERNATLDKAIEILMKAQNTCMDVIDAFLGSDAETIANKFKEINGTLKHARSLKVLDKDITPQTPQKEPPKNEPKDEKPKLNEPYMEALEAAREFYGLGLASLKSKQYEKAREFFSKSIAYNKDFPEAYANLGDLCTILKEEEAGYGYYQQCIGIINALQSPSEEMIKLRDDTMLKIEKFRLLEEKITALNNELISKLLDLVNQCINEEDYILSEEILSLVSQLDKDNEEASGLLEKVREEINNGLKDKPVTENNELADLYYQSAQELLKNNKYDEAIDKFNKALSYRAEFPEILFNLGECYRKINDNKKALNSYRLCTKCLKQRLLSKEDEKLLSQVNQAMDKIDPNSKKFTAIKNIYNTASSLTLANDCVSKKLNSFARRILQYLLLVDPFNKKAQELLERIGQAQTVSDTKPDKKPEPDKTDAMEEAKKYHDLGMDYFNKGELDKSITNLTQAIKLNPKDGDAYLYRGGAYGKKGEFEKAMADFSEAFKLKPQDPVVYHTRGFVYYSMGNMDKAISDFTQAISLNRTSIPAAYFHRARAYAKKDKFKMAITDAESFLRLAPKHRYADEARELINEWKYKLEPK